MRGVLCRLISLDAGCLVMLWIIESLWNCKVQHIKYHALTPYQPHPPLPWSPFPFQGKAGGRLQPNISNLLYLSPRHGVVCSRTNQNYYIFPLGGGDFNRTNQIFPYISTCSFTTRWNISPSFSAAFLHKSIRSRKISKYSVTVLYCGSRVSFSVISVFPSFSTSSDAMTE